MVAERLGPFRCGPGPGRQTVPGGCIALDPAHNRGEAAAGSGCRASPVQGVMAACEVRLFVFHASLSSPARGVVDVPGVTHGGRVRVDRLRPHVTATARRLAGSSFSDLQLNAGALYVAPLAPTSDGRPVLLAHPPHGQGLDELETVEITADTCILLDLGASEWR